MNEKQQQLTFEKGITNVPSDALCSDNTLEESLGMIYEDGEHRVIQRPVVKMTTSSNVYDVLYIHNYNDKKRYIVSVFRQAPTAGTYLGWGVVNQGVLEPSGNFGIATPNYNDFSITSVGKTLIVADSNGMHYFLWDIDNDTYKDIGDIEVIARTPHAVVGIEFQPLGVQIQRYHRTRYRVIGITVYLFPCQDIFLRQAAIDVWRGGPAGG